MKPENAKNKWKKRKFRKVLGPTLVAIGLIYTYHSHLTGCPRQVILGGWAMGPPVWFILIRSQQSALSNLLKVILHTASYISEYKY